MRNRRPIAFTLIELLVVITIIVVLLALLTPALDKAIYQAEMAVDMAQFHALGLGVHQYAAGQQRRYPYRRGPNEFGWKPCNIYVGSPFATDTEPDDRPILRDYISINGVFNDPFTDKVDYDNSDRASQLEIPWNLWFGWRYRGAAGEGTGMFRIGNRWTYQPTAGEVHSFEWLASDHDGMSLQDSQAINAHADKDGVMESHSLQDSSDVPAGAGGFLQYTFSRWQATATHQRGPVDHHYLHADGSVVRFVDVLWNDHDPPDTDRAVLAPMWSDGQFANWKVQIAKMTAQ